MSTAAPYAHSKLPITLFTMSKAAPGESKTVTGTPEMLVEAAPHHEAYQVGNRGAANVQRADVSAVAQHRHTVGNLRKLFKPVRYIQDRYPLRLESAEYAEEFPYLPLREARSGFVQDQNRRLPGQRVGYLNHLLLSDAQL